MSDALPGQPTRSTLIRWLQTNLALTTFVFGLLSGAIGTVVSVTWGAAKIDTRLEALEGKVVSLETDLRERTQRRNQLATDLGAINGKIDVHSAQLLFLGQAVQNLTIKPLPVRGR